MNKLIALALTSLFLLSCGGKNWSQSNAEVKLLEARALWAENGPSDYQYTWRKSCFCINNGHITATIENSEFVSAIFVDTDEVPPKNQSGYFETVESWFDFIDSVIERNPDRLTITYNADYGYPESINIDYIAQAVDDETSYFMFDFK